MTQIAMQNSQCLQSFPILTIIGLYERYFIPAVDEDEDDNRNSKLTFYNLSRNIQSMPLIEAIVGSHSTTVYDAIFDVELSSDQKDAMFAEFDKFDEDTTDMRSFSSTEDLPASPSYARSRTRSPRGRDDIIREPTVSNQATPRRARPDSLRVQLIPDEFDIHSSPSKPKSRLSRIFGAPRITASASDNTMNTLNATAIPPSISDDALTSIRRVEAALQDIRELPVHRLQEEMREVQVRCPLSLSIFDRL